MQLGMVGLGRMGGNMTTRLVRGGHRVVGQARRQELIDAAVALGATGAATLPALVEALVPPRTVWLMLPAGDATESALRELGSLLSEGDLIVDGGNSYYKDTVRHASEASGQGLHFVDVGTSGGIWGLEEGYSMMVGGDADDVARLRPALETLAPAPDAGWGHVGGHGAGHYVKMVHNGIEYGLMEAYAEGLAVLDAKKEYGIDLAQVTRIWQRGSVIRSWLLDLTADALKDRAKLDQIAPFVSDSGEGRWTVLESLDLNVSAPVIMLALERRIRSRESDPLVDKLLAAMRQEFGGHAVKTE
ncbi:MAG: decarboxylating 6-phosphogluconate dehydrogenase [Thermoplasmata archaeon]|nr:decarboxylating 6-phosphogluconate dehydrogenase [Thermoplasmata archaeon]MCI4359493.1 decarboxylating 6-phosphogluconate dehydrogenase [Thermoplasmata archaeon]